MSGLFAVARKLKADRVSRKLAVVSRSSPNPTPNGVWLIGVVLVLITLIIFGKQYMGGEEIPPQLIRTPEGEISLSPERQAKLDKELEELDNAEQYVLRATIPKEYPCYSCPDGQKTIFLRTGEVWKYGTTRKGEAGRYPGKNYGAPDVAYFIQFEGPFGECLKQEKLRIYNYPLLPEALARETILIRPPGNRNDN